MRWNEDIDTFVEEICRARTQEAVISDPLNIILLDTDVFSYLMEPGDPRGRPYLRRVEGRNTALATP